MKRNSKGTVSVILVLAVVALVGYFIISSIQLRMDIKEKSRQVSELSAQISQQDRENAEIEDILDESESAYLEHYARENDYIMPNERVYADSAS